MTYVKKPKVSDVIKPEDRDVVQSKKLRSCSTQELTFTREPVKKEAQHSKMNTGKLQE